MREEMAVLVTKDNHSFWVREQDACITKPGTKDQNVFIKNCLEGDLTPGQIIILRPTDSRVPNVIDEDGDPEILYYWEIVDGSEQNS